MAAEKLASRNSSVATDAAADYSPRVLTLDELEPAAATLAEAFADDHIARYFVDTPDRAHWSDADKHALHCSIFRYLTCAHMLKGLVTSAGPDYGCVALWLPPGTHMNDTLVLFRSGLWRLYYKLCREGRARFFDEFSPLLVETKLEILGAERDVDSYYLVYIGTRPSAQGMGLGKRVIRDMTAKADKEGKTCYLESSGARNEALYGKLGFAIRKRISLVRAEEKVGLGIMVREPAPPDANIETEETESETGNVSGGGGTAQVTVRVAADAIKSADKGTAGGKELKAYAVVKA